MSDLSIDDTDGVRTITIERPPVNALSTELLIELRHAVAAAGADLEVRCLVVTGAGDRFFVAGADVREAAQTPPDRAGERTALGQEVMAGLEALAIPVIAAINGACLGGGCELAMAADIRVASSGATFAQPEVRLGIMPGFGGTQRLPRLIGYGRALDLLLTGHTIAAPEALAIGLVSRVVPPGDLQQVAAGMAREVSQFAPFALEAIKLAVRGGLSANLPDGLALERELSGRVRASADAIEGLVAFRDKRVARFSTRRLDKP